jgi:hypothetical protein
MSEQPSGKPMLAHIVYFTLRDGTPAAQQKLADACRRYLKEIPGIVFSAVGTPTPDLARPVNIRDFHVGLHIVFASRKAHDDYQVHPGHQRFIAENKETWQQVRVFDCDL